MARTHIAVPESRLHARNSHMRSVADLVRPRRG